MLFWLSTRELRAVHEVVRQKWSDELEARRTAERKADAEAAARARRRSETFGRLMQRIERRLSRQGGGPLSAREIVLTPTRKQILRVLWDAPGLSTRGVARAVDLADATAGYHLDRLVKAGEIVVERVGRVAAHYPNGWGDAKARRYASLSVEARAALAVLKNLGIARAADVSRWSGIPIGATRHALALCEERGLVRRRETRGFLEVVG